MLHTMNDKGVFIRGYFLYFYNVYPCLYNREMDTILKNDVRTDAFKTCIRFINYEKVMGDVCEFGVYTGRSFATLAHLHNTYGVTENRVNAQDTPTRTFYGFDSWEGLPADSENHPRWVQGLFKCNHSYHPTIAQQDVVTPEHVSAFFKSVGIDTPHVLVKSSYDELDKLPETINSIALCHIDCDLFDSTKIVLNLIKSKLVNGSIIMFDDWYNYKGDPTKGEQRAFREFLQENTHIHAEEFIRYATFCKAFVMTIM